MSNPKRLHPIASVLMAGKRMKNLFFPIAALVFSAGREDRMGLMIVLIIALAAVIVTLVTGIISWLRYTYRFEQDELRIEYGVFVRKKRYIPFERIQSINITEGLLQRVFGLVKVQIETAGGDEEAEAVLSAISKDEANRIQDYVAAAKHGVNGENEEVQAVNTVYAISAPELLVLSLTSGGVGVVISAMVAVLSQLDDFIPYKKLFGGLEKWAVQNIMITAIIVFIGFFLAWIISLLLTMLKYANFKVVKTEKDFIISHGLLERKQITIPLKRIQAIRINENIVRQILGYGTVYVESAGGSMENQEAANVTLLPIVKVKLISSILEPHLPDYQLEPAFIPAPKRSLRRYILRSWFVPVPIVIAAVIFLNMWGLLSLLLLGFMTVNAVLKFRAAGWSLGEQQLALRFRTINRITVIMKKNKIQSLEMKESYFQQKKDLGTIGASVKSGAGGGGGTVLDLESSDIQKVYQWYSRGKSRKAGVEV